jgi:hypothetical protein
MKADSIIEAVVEVGGELTVSGDRIRYRLPKDHPEKERILDELREHKREIIRLLSTRPQTCAPSCYEIAPARWIHHPWNGCTTPMPPEKARREAERTCWHCGGEGKCTCIACWDARYGVPDECFVCQGSGTTYSLLQ